MRVLHATAGKALGDGVQRAVTGLARGLERLGVDSRILSRGPGPGYTYRCLARVLDSCPSLDALAKALNLADTVDLIHVHLSKPPSEALLAAAALSGKPVVVTIHAIPYKYTWPAAPMSHVYVSTLLSLVSRLVRGPIVFPSRGAVEDHRPLVDHVLDRVRVVPHGAGPPPGVEAPRPREGGHRGYAVYIGRFSEEKGFTTLILAAKRALASSRGTRLLLVGSGSLSWMARRLASMFPGRVVYTGWVGQDRVYRILAARPGLVVAPSLTETYNFAVADAIYYGVPVVASRIGAHKDLLGPDYPGLFDPGDYRALARLIESPGETAEELEPHIATARRRLPSWDDAARGYLEIYRVSTG